MIIITNSKIYTNRCREDIKDSTKKNNSNTIEEIIKERDLLIKENLKLKQDYLRNAI